MKLELKRQFKEKLNIDLDTIEIGLMKSLAKVIKKGKISTEDEYRLVEWRIDEISANENSRDEVEKLNNLLISYQKE